ncbi:MAG: glucose-6-phosphate isomerase [Spirochaetaceae bacterium]|nr:glucose-6-phosphate isomerase [Spirochaetaceae bacterium]|tara:strand:- start:93389 stop:94648 length:1260 start_codon:yes stop_codon:yes gene_type:complete
MQIDLQFSTISQAAIQKSQESRKILESRSGSGNDFLGWLQLPEEQSGHVQKYLEIAADLQKLEAVVMVGIGGSYLGFKCLYEALRPAVGPVHGPEILFAGHSLDGHYHQQLLEYLEQKDFGVVVISKSGTTTEPAIAFRLLWGLLQKKHGAAEASRRVCAITDEKKGTLRQSADSLGFHSAVIADDVGGRFSVLSPVGLIPAAIAGVDIYSLLQGSMEMCDRLRNDQSPENPAVQYSAYRNGLYEEGKKIEILVYYQHSLQYLAEWWKQLFGESEGKNGLGVFPASAGFTTDLHSLGQWIQQSERTIFQTILDVEEARSPVLAKQENDGDGLNYLAGKSVHDVNRVALQATRKAHGEGGVPSLRISVPRVDEFHLGQIFYFFEYACGVSAYALGVNPFDQPGVEDYKNSMFKMLGKPGY